MFGVFGWFFDLVDDVDMYSGVVGLDLCVYGVGDGVVVLYDIIQFFDMVVVLMNGVGVYQICLLVVVQLVMCFVNLVDVVVGVVWYVGVVGMEFFDIGCVYFVL